MKHFVCQQNDMTLSVQCVCVLRHNIFRNNLDTKYEEMSTALVIWQLKTAFGWHYRPAQERCSSRCPRNIQFEHNNSPYIKLNAAAKKKPTHKLKTDDSSNSRLLGERCVVIQGEKQTNNAVR